MSTKRIGTSQGMLSKIVIDNKIIKGASEKNLEPFSEYIGSRIFAKFSGLPTVIYDIIPDSGFQVKSSCGYLSICDKVDYEIFNLYKYMQIRGKRLSNVLNLYKEEKLSEEYFIRMLVMDALIGNQDRHWNNFDIFIDKDGILKNAPVLDFGASLLYNVPDKDLKVTNGVGRDLAKPLDKKTHFNQVKYIKKTYGTPKLFDFTWLDLMTLVIECYKNLPEDKFSIKRRIVLLHYLKNRYSQYITPFLK